MTKPPASPADDGLSASTWAVEECTACSHGDLEAFQVQGAPLVHADGLGRALIGQDLGKLVDGHHLGVGGLGQGHGLPHVIAVAVGDQDHVHRPHLVNRGVEEGVAEPGVNDHIHTLAGQLESRVTVKGDADVAADYFFRHGCLQRQEIKSISADILSRGPG